MQPPLQRAFHNHVFSLSKSRKPFFHCSTPSRVHVVDLINVSTLFLKVEFVSSVFLNASMFNNDRKNLNPCEIGVALQIRFVHRSIRFTILNWNTLSEYDMCGSFADISLHEKHEDKVFRIYCGSSFIISYNFRSDYCHKWHLLGIHLFYCIFKIFHTIVFHMLPNSA